MQIVDHHDMILRPGPAQMRIIGAKVRVVVRQGFGVGGPPAHGTSATRATISAT